MRPDRSGAIVALSIIVLFVNNGFILAGVTAFDSVLLQKLNIAIATLKLRDTITLGTLAVSAPIAGWLLDRVGVRPMIVMGCLMMGLGILVYSEVTNVRQIYAIHGVFGLSQVSCGIIVNVILISRWTGRRRGLAIGFLVAGSSLGNAVAPSINAALLTMYGWQRAMQIDGVIALALVPAVILIIREQPADALNGAGNSLEPWSADGPSVATALASRTFWLLAIVAMTTFFCVVGLVTNLILLAQNDFNLSLQVSASSVFLFFAAAVIAQLLAGMLDDRFGPRFLHLGSIGVMILASTMLLSGLQGSLWSAVFLFGLGWGGNYALLQILPASLFAGRAVGLILGLFAFLDTVGGALGPVVMGYIRDVSGSYRAAFEAMILLCGISFICAYRLYAPCRHGASLRASLGLH